MPLSIRDPMFRALRDERVLEPVDSHRIQADKGVIFVPCGDGDQFHDLYGHFARVLQPRHSESAPRIHVLSLNGGALTIPERSPLNQTIDQSVVMLDNIVGAYRLKGIPTVILEVHTPCGMARIANLTLIAQIDLLIQAKLRVKEHLPPEAKVACFCHVDREDRKLTYFVSVQQWRRFRDLHPSAIFEQRIGAS